MEETKLYVGIVKWFNNGKGYGYITTEVDGEPLDVFCYYSSIKAEGFRTLQQGALVEFTMKEGPKGWHAVTTKALRTPEEHAASEGAKRALNVVAKHFRESIKEDWSEAAAVVIDELVAGMPQ
jgi:CspA family cold shock protein